MERGLGVTPGNINDSCYALRLHQHIRPFEHGRLRVLNSSDREDYAFEFPFGIRPTRAASSSAFSGVCAIVLFHLPSEYVSRPAEEAERCPISRMISVASGVDRLRRVIQLASIVLFHLPSESDEIRPVNKNVQLLMD